MAKANWFGLALAMAGLFLAGCKSTAPSSANSEVSPIPEANQTAPSTQPTEAEINRTLPMLFIVGDSTVHNSAPGLLGWGDVLGRYFDPRKIIVENHAKPGRSSRTFQTQGWWAQIMNATRPGDFVLIQMGDNDGGRLDDTNRSRASIPGIGNESREIYNPVMHKPELVHTYGWYMRKYITDARAKGMIPIICSPVPRLPEHTVKAGDVDKTGYVKWSAEVARQEHAFFIPLNHLVLEHYVGMTPREIKAKYFTTHDNTHDSPAGAALNASAVIEGLRKAVPELASMLLAEPRAANPTMGEDGFDVIVGCNIPSGCPKNLIWLGPRAQPPSSLRH